MWLISSRAIHTDMACISHIEAGDSKDSVEEDAPIAETQMDDNHVSGETITADTRSEVDTHSKDGQEGEKITEEAETPEGKL